MNKASIVDKVHEKLGGTKVQAEQVVDTVFDSIVAGLKKGDEVSIAGLGIFFVVRALLALSPLLALTQPIKNGRRSRRF